MNRTYLRGDMYYADLLYHEATYAHAEHKIARERGHSTAVEAARIALKAGDRKSVV